jgi:hypothetical protein
MISHVLEQCCRSSLLKPFEAAECLCLRMRDGTLFGLSQKPLLRKQQLGAYGGPSTSVLMHACILFRGHDSTSL